MRVVLLFLGGMFIVSHYFAQQTFTINASFDKLSDDYMAFYSYKNGYKFKLDSVAIKNNKFTITDTITEPTNGSLFIKKPGKRGALVSQMRNIYFEPAVFTIVGKKLMSTATVTGTTMEEDKQRLVNYIKPEDTEIKALQEKVFKYTIRNKADKAKPYVEKITALKETALKPKLLAFARENNHRLIALTAINAAMGINEDYVEIEDIMQRLPENIKTHKSAISLQKLIESKVKTIVGKAAPLFVQADTAGNMVSLTDFKGKYVLIDFWASWCGPCRSENPNVVAAFEKFKDKNFTILGISLDRKQDKEKWMQAIYEDKLLWAQVSDLNFWSNEVAQLYGVTAIPQNVLVDPNGIIVAKNLRGNNLQEKLAEVIK